MKHLSTLLVMVILVAAIIVTGPVITVLASEPVQVPTSPNKYSSDSQGPGGFYVDGPTQMQATLGRQVATVNQEVYFDGPTQMATTFGGQEPIAAEIISAPSNSTRFLSFEPQGFNEMHFDGPTHMQAALGPLKTTASPEIYFDGPTQMQAVFGK